MWRWCGKLDHKCFLRRPSFERDRLCLICRLPVSLTRVQWVLRRTRSPRHCCPGSAKETNRSQSLPGILVQSHQRQFHWVAVVVGKTRVLQEIPCYHRIPSRLHRWAIRVCHRKTKIWIGLRRCWHQSHRERKRRTNCQREMRRLRQWGVLIRNFTLVQHHPLMSAPRPAPRLTKKRKRRNCWPGEFDWWINRSKWSLENYITFLLFF